MRIVILAVDCPPFHAKSLDERPLGGTITGAIRLAEDLQNRGHEVTVVTNFKDPPPSSPKYVPYEKLSTLELCDVFIVVRGWSRIYYSPFYKRFKKRFLWTGDGYGSLYTIGMGDKRVIKDYDGLLGVSNWHIETLCQKSGFPKTKTWVIRNGVHLPYFEGQETRHRKRLIYSSLPHRGLIFLPHIFDDLKKKHPDLELHVFGSFDRNSEEWAPGIKRDPNPIYEKALSHLKETAGCTFHGSILQKDLAREYMKSAILTYPCNSDVETSCITAMEAQAAGCAIVTSDIGALKETVGNAGILIPEEPGSKAYLSKFIEVTDRILSDDALFNKLSQISLEQAKKLSWTRTADSLLSYLKLIHNLE